MLTVDGKWGNISYAVTSCGKLVDRNWKEQMK
jgi:hypothetical protein